MNKYKSTVIKFDNDEAAKTFNEFLPSAWNEIATFMKQSLQGKGIESDPSIEFNTDTNTFTISVASMNKGFVLVATAKNKLETVNYDDLDVEAKYSTYNRARGLDIFIKRELVDEFVGAAPSVHILAEELFDLKLPEPVSDEVSKEMIEEATVIADKEPQLGNS